MITVQELKQNFIVTDLERRLKEDKAGATLGKMENELSELTAQVETRKKSGLPPEEFFQVDRLLSSLRVAGEVVRRIWNGFHAR